MNPMPEDKINPEHYRSGTLEVIELIEDAGLARAFCLANAIKYLCRAGRKDGSPEDEDLAKATWYLDREAAQQEPLALNVVRRFSREQVEGALEYLPEARRALVVGLLFGTADYVHEDEDEDEGLPEEEEEGEGEGEYIFTEDGVCLCFFEGVEPGAVVYADADGDMHLKSAAGIWCEHGQLV